MAEDKDMHEAGHELGEEPIKDDALAEKVGEADPDSQTRGESTRGNKPAVTDEELENRRKKRLELNRKAAQESRRRKKLRIEELQRSVVFLSRENCEVSAFPNAPWPPAEPRDSLPSLLAGLGVRRSFGSRTTFCDPCSPPT